MVEQQEQQVLPILAQRGDLAIVNVDGQPVVTARDLARALGYADERSVLRIYNRNKESFRERDPRSELKYDTGVVKLTTNPQGGNPYVRYFTKRGALKVCMKSNQPKAVMVQEMLIDLYEAVERRELVQAGPGLVKNEIVQSIAAMQQQLWQMSNQLAQMRREIEVKPLPVPGAGRRYGYGTTSCDRRALDYIHQLFFAHPEEKTNNLIEMARRKAKEEGWKVGSRATLYRIGLAVRRGTHLLPTTYKGVNPHAGQAHPPVPHLAQQAALAEAERTPAADKDARKRRGTMKNQKTRR